MSYGFPKGLCRKNTLDLARALASARLLCEIERATAR